MYSYIKLIRPRQWTKNLFVFGAIIFANRFLDPILLAKTILGFLIFCALSGSVYVLNDIIDAEIDKHDPNKCKRPIASGKIKKSNAVVYLVILASISLVSAYFLNSDFFYLSISYLILNIFYSFYLKKIVIVDIIVVAFGFLIRALAGIFIIKVNPSTWFLLCTFMLATLLASSKRRYEFLQFKSTDVNKKKAVLTSYSEQLLDQLISISATGALISYSIYTTIAPVHYSLIFTVPLVLYGIFRYLFIVYKKGEGGSPEKILLNDPHILSTVILYGITISLIMYFTRH